MPEEELFDLLDGFFACDTRFHLCFGRDVN